MPLEAGDWAACGAFLLTTWRPCDVKHHCKSTRAPLKRAPNPRQQHETPTDNLLHPPAAKKIRAEAKAAAKTRAPRPWAPLLAARLRQLAGGTQRALLDAAHTQGPPHHCNTMMDMDAIFPMVRARPASSPPRKDTLSVVPPPLDAAAALRRRSVRAWQASPLLAPATPLPIIFIACSPLLLRSAPLPLLLRSASLPANASVAFPPETARLAAHRQLVAAP